MVLYIRVDYIIHINIHIYIFICTTSKKFQKEECSTYFHTPWSIFTLLRTSLRTLLRTSLRTLLHKFSFLIRFLDGQEPKKFFICTTSKKKIVVRISTHLRVYLHSCTLYYSITSHFTTQLPHTLLHAIDDSWMGKS